MSIALSVSPPDTGDEVMGDEDEGFDEEFCDSEESALRAAPEALPLYLQDLNHPDLQTLLAEEGSLADSATFPTASLLDDIDPGVYMLEAEHSTHSLLDPLPEKSHCTSPAAAPSPVCPDMQTMSLADSAAVIEDWDFTSCQHMFGGAGGYDDSHFLEQSVACSGSFSEYGSSINSAHHYTSTHCHLPPPSPSSSPPPSSASDYDLEMLVSSMCGSSQPVHAKPTSPGPAFSTQASAAHQPIPFACNLTLQMSFGNHPAPSLPSVSSRDWSGSPSPSPLSSARAVPSTPNQPSNAGYSPSPSGVTRQGTGCEAAAQPGSSPRGMRTGGCFSCSTQTPLSPTPSSTASCSVASLANSCDDSDVPKGKRPSSDKGIVHMPFYQLKKMLDSPSLPEVKKTNIKNIRRRGKNKIAAKNCRQRKLSQVMGLQQEIEKLQDLKSQFSSKTGSLQREIEMLKAKCTSFRCHVRPRAC